MNRSRPDVVFDCNIYLQAISRNHGPAARALALVDKNEITLYLSKAILRELRRTLEYPEIREKNPHITDELIEDFLGHLAFRGVLVRNVAHVFDYPRDPDDEPYVDLAAAVHADYLVTRDNDLLCLATDHSIEAKQFRQQFPFIRITEPVGFLADLSA